MSSPGPASRRARCSGCPRASRGEAGAASPGRIGLVEQRIAWTTICGGTRVAYATAGHGPFLVYVPGWLTHLELSWAMPPERAFCEALARGRTLVRYDRP